MHRALISVAVLICIGLSAVFLIRGAPDDLALQAGAETALYTAPEPGSTGAPDAEPTEPATPDPEPSAVPPSEPAPSLPEPALPQPAPDTAVPSTDTVLEEDRARAATDDPGPAERDTEPAGVGATLGDAVEGASQAVVDTVDEVVSDLVPGTDTRAEPAVESVSDATPDTPVEIPDMAVETSGGPADTLVDQPDWAELLSVENFDADALIAAIEASEVSRVTRRAAIAALEAARDTPELRDTTLNQVRTLLGVP